MYWPFAPAPDDPWAVDSDAEGDDGHDDVDDDYDVLVALAKIRVKKSEEQRRAELQEQAVRACVRARACVWGGVLLFCCICLALSSSHTTQTKPGGVV